jgi:O-succinylbenzoic acid--CoA ligase
MERRQPTAVVTLSRSRLARAIWLAMYDGLPLLVMNPAHTAPGRLMRRCGVDQAIVDAQVRLPEGVRRLPSRSLDSPGGGASLEPSPLDMSKTQLMVPTSGTEGPARAVMLSSRNISTSALATNRVLGLTRHHRWLCCLPLIHIGGIMILMRCAAAGARVRLKEGFDPADAAAALLADGITHVSVVPAMLHRLLEADADPSGLAAVLVGGAGASDHLVRRALKARWPLKVAYGLTETTAHVALGDLLRSDRSMAVLPGTRIDVTTEDDDTDKSVGWIRVAGPTVMLGYANPGLIPGDGLAGKQSFRTKDLGRLDKDGRLVVLGRGDDVLISGGVNVHPAQVEDLLSGCPGIREVAVTGRPDPVWGARLVALYSGDADEASVTAWCRENIPGPMRPREIRRIQRLPRTPLGKIRRRNLRDLI